MVGEAEDTQGLAVLEEPSQYAEVRLWIQRFGCTDDAWSLERRDRRVEGVGKRLDRLQKPGGGFAVCLHVFPLPQQWPCVGAGELGGDPQCPGQRVDDACRLGESGVELRAGVACDDLGVLRLGDVFPSSGSRPRGAERVIPGPRLEGGQEGVDVEGDRLGVRPQIFTVRVNPMDPSPEQVRCTEGEALANLRAVLELCAAGEVRCSDKTSRPSAATVRTVGAHLVDGDFYPEEPIAAFAWPLLLQAGGLASLDGTRLRLTPKGRAALGKPSVEAIRSLWRRWLTHAVIDEFSRVEQSRVSSVAVRCQDGRRSWFP